jgi:hypothetical protein
MQIGQNLHLNVNNKIQTKAVIKPFNIEFKPFFIKSLLLPFVFVFSSKVRMLARYYKGLTKTSQK